VLSTRPDLLPPEVVEELGRLQDHVAPAPWDQVEQVLAADLGRPVNEVFADFDREPLAAASVAQVHAARLRSGAEVAVKVQQPAIRTVVERDLDIVAGLAPSLEARTRWARSIGVRELAVGFADAVREELDFRIEAANMAGVAASADGTVRIPAPHQPLCGERVLVMQLLEGTPLSAAAPALDERGLDRQALARQLLASVLAQVLLTGVFHADPHPGNVLVLADGRLGLLDFGSVGRIDGSLRAALQRLLLAMDRGDPLGASDALLEVMPRRGRPGAAGAGPRPVHGQVPERGGQPRRPHVQRPVPDRDRLRAVGPAGGRGHIPGPGGAQGHAHPCWRPGSIWSPRRVPSPAAKVPAGWWTRPSPGSWSPTS
jgi:ubiquinone biosynthesis protein